jgi:Flp pilus assembly protein TadD
MVIKASIPYFMRIWKIAAIAALGLVSLAAENVAPTKSELEDMYNKAFRAFDANNFPEALRELDAIDARQPDLAASKNLRGVVLMRQGAYDKAEAALLEAARIDPKFWNARFNLAEIPFLKKDWAEARKRFQQLLSSSESDLAKEASQLIQYKILLTYLLEKNENMVDSILAKLELSPDTPAIDYVKAAVALQQKNQKEARDWITAAEKSFSPQLNKLFAESLYEVGWLERPTGETRASLPIMTTAERAEKAKALARSKFEQAQQALRQRDYATATKLIDEADQAEPNQSATLNLRGEILMEQKQFDEAEAAFKKAVRLDPKFSEAQYNYAQIPFKKKDYATARERFEALFKQTPGGDKNQAAELIKFKIYMTLLLEGKESRAQAMMEQFQFTGDTPALYYAQAAWEFKHNNPQKAEDWTASAKKIYSPALNSVFADAFYDIGWLQGAEAAGATAPAFDTASAIASQAEGSPAVEPSPIPDSVFAANKQTRAARTESTASLSPASSPPVTGLEATSGSAQTEQPPVSSQVGPVAAQASGQPVEAPGAATTGPSVTESAAAASSPAETPITSSASAVQNERPSAGQTEQSTAPVAVANAVNIPQPTTLTWAVSRRTWLVGGLLLAGIFLLAWVVVPELRRYTFNVPSYLQIKSLVRSRVVKARSVPARTAPAQKGTAVGGGFFGGPRHVSLRLVPSKPSSGRTAFPLANLNSAFHRVVDLEGKSPQASAYRKAETDRESQPLNEPVFESSVGPVIEQTAETFQASVPQTPEPAEFSVAGQRSEPSAVAAEEPGEIAAAVGQIVPLVEAHSGGSEAESSSVLSAAAAEEPSKFAGASVEAAPVAEMKLAEPEVEPTGEGRPIDYEAVPTPVDSSLPRAVIGVAAHSPKAISTEPVVPQITTHPTMPETTQIPTTPATKPPPAAAAKPQPVSAAQTSVQLTFSFEIASVQLTPNFKMSVLRVRPISKVVTMRLPPSVQSALNLQVNFEVAKIQPAGGTLGTIRMLPSQHQRVTTGTSPSFTVAGLQVVPNFETAPVQLTPSQQGQAAVFVTVPFQITTIEFSPSLEIAAVVLNSASKQVTVQLPAAASAPGEGAPVFEIANLQLSESGDIAMMQLNLLGHGPKRA